MKALKHPQSEAPKLKISSSTLGLNPEKTLTREALNKEVLEGARAI